MIRSMSSGFAAGALQAAFRRLAAQLHRMLHVLIVGFLQVARLNGVLDGENRVALVHLCVVHDGHHRFQAPLRDVEDAAHVVLHVVASDGVLGQGRGRCGDGAGPNSGCDGMEAAVWSVLKEIPCHVEREIGREGRAAAGPSHD